MVEGVSEADLRADFRAAGGPLGDFCSSLHDLLAHVLMWDEIALAVLAEASQGRRHWSLDPRWETGDAGRALNMAGVLGGRSLPSDLLVHRYSMTTSSLIAAIRHAGRTMWTARLAFDPSLTGGVLAENAMKVPGYAPYWHAAIHLRTGHVTDDT
jgi:hypothetical protein